MSVALEMNNQTNSLQNSTTDSSEVSDSSALDSPSINSVESTESNTTNEAKKEIKKKFRYYENYLSRLLKQIAPQNEITLNARQQLNYLLINLSRIISVKSLRLTEFSKKKTLSVKEVKNAIKLVIPSDLYNYCCETANNSVENYDEDKTGSRQKKAGIIFPPSISEKFLRSFNNSNLMITSKAPVFMASVLEYITSEILEEAASISSSDNRVRITIRDLELSIRGDLDFTTLFNKNGLQFLGGGVQPFIHPSIKYDKNNERTAISYDIEKFQKTADCLMLAKHPFDQLTRNIIHEIKPESKVSSNVLLIIQYYIEQWIISILQKSNMLSLYSNRIKLISTDIEMVLAIQENRIPSFLLKKNSNDQIKTDKPDKPDISNQQSASASVLDSDENL